MQIITQNQADRILGYMETHPSITSLDAIREFGCTRLSARISDLRKKGYPIIGNPVMVKNRDNKSVRVTAYSLAQDGDLYE